MQGAHKKQEYLIAGLLLGPIRFPNGCTPSINLLITTGIKKNFISFAVIKKMMAKL